ncbi:xanthine dehydrogenase small subunit [Pelagibacterium halotolerans]|uniref:xanthine dehydrogenase small subunit n=1 Tax=Pelagibacterium halotolerans TaxID=531813 RepID=UPI001476EEE6|nr:xanthine dehydrogenase small subunit [Pelagibacterium halotolerans]QJR20523.1 xanthine dehydrogenase small subunit [Pelagibacterium halotolerans]
MSLEPRTAIRFYLNDNLIELDTLEPDRTLLDFLRLDRVLRGTKEGCAEGDCGACTVIVGRISGGVVRYLPANACIILVSMLDGAHVVTVEHLKGPDGGLHPVQQAMVDYHGSQCGFCTPGFVMSLYGLWLANPNPSVPEIEKALQGNLCRCTGYAPIVRAAQAVSNYGSVLEDALNREREEIVAKLTALRDGRLVVVEGARGKTIIPADVDGLAAVLTEMPEATIVAGATDVGLWVTKFMRDIAPVVIVGHLMGEISVEDGRIVFGAGVSYAKAFETIATHIPQMVEMFDRIGGAQVRAMGTIGGNIANGSPIGDTPPPLIALGAEITLRKGDRRRVVKLEDFFIAYGRQDRKKGEFVEAVSVPQPGADEIFGVHKVTKRRDEDITATLGAFRVKIAGGVVAEATIAYGGMAATPKRARAVEAALIGKAWTLDTVEAALGKFEEDFQPLTDWRASADYRMLAAKNLLKRFYFESVEGPSHIVRHEVA